jgi:hypothetical protein
LELKKRVRDLALFNLALDSKLRAGDLTALKMEDALNFAHRSMGHRDWPTALHRPDRPEADSAISRALKSSSALPARSVSTCSSSNCWSVAWVVTSGEVSSCKRMRTMFARATKASKGLISVSSSSLDRKDTAIASRPRQDEQGGEGERGERYHDQTNRDRGSGLVVEHSITASCLLTRLSVRSSPRRSKALTDEGY